MSSPRFLRHLLPLALLCLLGSAWHTEPVVHLDRISVAARSDGQGYVVRMHTTGRPGFQPPRQSGNTVELLLRNTRRGASYYADPLLGPVQNVTAEQKGSDLVLRFLIDDAAALEISAYPDGASSHVLMALNYAARPPVNLPVQPVSTSGPASADTNPFLNTSKPSADQWRLDTVVIDAGHGGKDAGAVAHGIREKDLTLAVALKLGKYIEENLGLKVVYTRTDDRFVELKERGRIANKAGAKLFISIHINSVDGPNRHKAHGTEVFFLGLHRTDEAREVMERENGVIKLESDPNAYKAFGGDFILQSLAQSSFLRESEQLAMLIDEQFRTRVQRRSRGVKQAGFLVLVQASMPAVLVELGFITNPEEVRFLASERGQDYLASAIFRAVRDYKSHYEKGLNIQAER